MNNLYETIQKMCKDEGISISEFCRRTGISRGAMGDLASGRSKTMNAENASKTAKYFNVPISVIYGTSENRDEELKFALFGASKGITDEMMQEVLRYAKYVKEREK